MTTVAKAATNETSFELREMKLMSGLSLPDKSFAFYNLTVTDNVFSQRNSSVHLSFNVYASSFGSDPDLFVSKVSSHRIACLRIRFNRRNTLFLRKRLSGTAPGKALTS